ncbi:amino acid ABC transporter substrate-binding protein [Desulfosporosinus fructosivorans]|uniref:Amino acid ABC transporter substrate-binding protein n=1 Tax=Desulfosporosinus fructosivorans TaxID=2018669 RepID=A0A4Z0RA97_9FIRM|nr:ABC transporter substrate-binding protein [Desulfosporosinus fructosivorans]TGE38566.1 amino acid ABC transporter substrate-binding protein [Desulfosporosinus fructosivorans]
MKLRKSTLLILSAVFISCFIYLQGCNLKSEAIKIGVVGTMSGINSDLSVSGRRGVEIAIDELNRAGGLEGKKIELIVKDDKFDSTIALNVDKEFINENIPVVIGHYTSGMMVNSIDYLRDKDILFLSPTISADSLSGIDDNFIRFIATTQEQAIVLADIAKKYNYKQFAVIYSADNSGFNDIFYNNFKNLLEMNNGQVILTRTYTSSVDLDYVSLAKDLAESKAEAILLIAGAADNAQIVQQLRKTGSKVQIYAPLWSNTANLIINGGAAVEGMFVLGAIDINSKSMELLNFKEKYYERYGENVTFSAVYSYETTISLFQAMKMGPDLKPSTIKKNIISIMNFKGLDGNYQIDKFGDSIRKYMVFRVEDGQLRRID